MTLKEQLKKNFKFDFLQLPRMTQLYYFSVILSPWLKKFLKFNSPDWLNSTTFLAIVIPSPWLKKILKFNFLKRLKRLSETLNSTTFLS